MAYSPKGLMDIYEIVSRWHAGYSISHISRALNIDRKTVRRHLASAEQAGIARTEPLPPREKLLPTLAPLQHTIERPMPARSAFEPYRQEILDLLGHADDPLKPKTIYEVLCLRHSLKASYSSFKRFMRSLDADGSGKRTTCRFETDPGEELQIDYGKVGQIKDETGRLRSIHAFIGTLSFSRLKFIEFVFTQDQQSFVASHLHMFAFFCGVARILVIDNLKSGILKPDRFDPVLNPLYGEMAAHYGCFIDAARVRRPQDKGKVERAVPLARELFRKLKTLYPDLTLGEANTRALEWCRYDNGQQQHGTTGRKPWEHFDAEERAALIPLPETPFELATWKQVKVHPDQYIQFDRKSYSVPVRYVGQTLWARGTDRVIELYASDFARIKTHIRSRHYRITDPSDFPEDVRVMMKDVAVRQLLGQARRVGPATLAYVTSILEPHAKRNYRKAQGILGHVERFGTDQVEMAAATALASGLLRYHDFKELLLAAAPREEVTIPVTEATSAFVRPPEYFIH
jgi:transposase